MSEMKRLALIRRPEVPTEDLACLQAAYRGATAALRLKDFDKAHDLCAEALRGVPGDSDLSKLQEVGQQVQHALSGSLVS